MKCGLLLVITAMLLCTISQATAKAEDILLLSDQWCPYNCDPSSDHPGYAVEIVREAFQSDGLNVVYRAMNWARSVEETRVGHATAVIGMVIGESTGFIFPHEPIGVSAMGIAVRSDSDFHYAGPQSLDGKVIGLAAGYVFGGDGGAYIRQHQADRARVQIVSGDDALALNLRKLQAGRIDLVVDDANVLAHVLSQFSPDSHVKLAAVVDATPVYIAFSPALADSRALSTMLDTAIRRMRASGRLAEIMDRYGMRDWK